VAVASAGPYAHHRHFATDRKPAPHHSFLRAGCNSCCSTISVKALKALHCTSLLANKKLYKLSPAVCGEGHISVIIKMPTQNSLQYNLFYIIYSASQVCQG